MQIGAEMAKAIESRRVFVVDDNEIFRAAIQFMLHDEYEAHEIDSVGNGLAKMSEMTPDLIVIAENVIRESGFDLLQEFIARAPNVRVLVIVDSTSGGFGEKCLQEGAHGFVAKPLRVESVRERVDALLSRPKGIVVPLMVLNTR